MKFLITGGSRGLGRAIVLAAVAQGHEVAFTYRSRADAARAVEAEATASHPGARCQGYALDVACPDAVEAGVDQILDDFDDLNVLVNCAGIVRDNLVVSMSDEEWSQVLATNLSGPFFMIRQVLPTLIANRWGRIVNVSSISAHGSSGQANYAASKAGLHGLTLSVAKEWGRRGITCNAVVPGYFATDMSEDHVPDDRARYWQTQCPVPEGRAGLPQELAAAVLFLASQEASFINGELLHVSGGLNHAP